MHKVDQTVLEAVGIYEASCEAAGAPVSPSARIAAVSAALATHCTPEEVTARLMASVRKPPKPEELGSGETTATPARKPRASKGAK